MIIGIDATPLTVETGGIRRYTEELARALAAEPVADQVHLLSDQPFEFPSGTNLHVHQANGGRWWSVGLPAALRRHHIEVFHGTDFAVPYLNSRPSVMTLHDLSPWRQGDSRIRRRTPMLLRLGIATMVITPSEAVRREAIDHFGLHPPRVTVVPEAASELFHPRDLQPQEPPYILYAGTVEPRKNLGVLVEAWRMVRSQHPVRLVFAGRRRGVEEAPGVEYPGAVSDEELARLYSGASAVVSPTLYEGFGLPVLEAMQSGAPVIASRDPAVMETSGGAALHVEASDVRGWTTAMAAVVSDAALAASLRERGLKRAAEFSWARTARQTREVYREAIRRFHG